MAQQPSPSRRDGRVTDTRARIEAVALRLFVTKGFSATSLKDIADELGLTKAALYYHFPAKADLARSIFQSFIDDVDELLSRLAGADRPPREILTDYIETLLPHRAALQAMLRDPSAAAESDLEGVSARWLSQLTELLVHDDSTEARIRATVAVSGLTRVLSLPEASTAEIRRVGVESAVAALAAPGPVSSAGPAHPAHRLPPP